MSRAFWAARLRRQRQVERVHRLGPRVVSELIEEFRRHHPAAAADLDRRLERYSRIDPEMLHATGGDRMPPTPLRAVR